MAGVTDSHTPRLPAIPTRNRLRRATRLLPSIGKSQSTAGHMTARQTGAPRLERRKAEEAHDRAS
jgi:hypothetical protein